MDCRPACAACCTAPSISTPLPGHPQGKPAGVPCAHPLDERLRCRLFGRPERPAVCNSLRPSAEMCGFIKSYQTRKNIADILTVFYERGVDTVMGMPTQILREYFDVFEDSYRVKDKIRHRVDFGKHDLLRDPFETGFDLIVCRNVTIYFTEEAKVRLNQQFCQSLSPGGILFVGGTEAIARARELGLTTLGHCFYRKQPADALRTFPVDEERAVKAMNVRR